MLILSIGVLVSEALWIYIAHDSLLLWLERYFFLGVLVFIKGTWKRFAVLKFMAALKILGALLTNLGKLLLLKSFKTLGLRYGVFFSQQKWRHIRRAKIIFLRKGKMWSSHFRTHWKTYTKIEKIILILAFLPLFAVLFILGFSFDITRKTMVKKSQEAMALNTAKKAAHTNTGLSTWLKQLDQKTIKKIKQVTQLKTNSK